MKCVRCKKHRAQELHYLCEICYDEDNGEPKNNGEEILRLERELAEAREQRDTLAEALKLCEKHLEKHGHEKCDEELDETGWWLLCDVRTALAAVKGGSHE